MSKVVEFKTAYSAKKREKYNTTGESLTQQHFAEEADIRNIIKKYDKTGLITNVQKGVARYGDFSEVNEYREALDLVIAAEQTFGELPAEIRELFKNDAGEFFEFATDPNNEQEMIKLGLKEGEIVEAIETEKVAVPPSSEAPADE